MNIFLKIGHLLAIAAIVISVILILALVVKKVLDHPILLIDTHFTYISETTSGARARIAELEKQGKGIYEVIAILEDEGYIKEENK